MLEAKEPKLRTPISGIQTQVDSLRSSAHSSLTNIESALNSSLRQIETRLADLAKVDPAKGDREEVSRLKKELTDKQEEVKSLKLEISNLTKNQKTLTSTLVKMGAGAVIGRLLK